MTTTTIDAELIVKALRRVYTMPPLAILTLMRGNDEEAARQVVTLALGHHIPGLSDEQILAVARCRATLRGTLTGDGKGLTFHDVRCLTCNGQCWDVCPTCGGDGFSPPLSE